MYSEILRRAGVAEVIERGLTAITHSASSETNKLIAILKAIVSYPIKVCATFIFAPGLLLRIAWTGGKKHDAVRRMVAIVGLAMAILLTYVANLFILGWAGTFLSTLFIVDMIGILTAIAFVFGLSSLSVSFLILAFWSICFLFFKMTTQEVADYLREITS